MCLAKIRVYELAKELGKSSKDILQLLADSGVPGKNHMSALEENVARFVRNRFAERDGKASGQARAQTQPQTQAHAQARAQAEAQAQAQILPRRAQDQVRPPRQPDMRPGPRSAHPGSHQAQASRSSFSNNYRSGRDYNGRRDRRQGAPGAPGAHQPGAYHGSRPSWQRDARQPSAATRPAPAGASRPGSGSGPGVARGDRGGIVQSQPRPQPARPASAQARQGARGVDVPGRRPGVAPAGGSKEQLARHPAGAAATRPAPRPESRVEPSPRPEPKPASKPAQAPAAAAPGEPAARKEKAGDKVIQLAQVRSGKRESRTSERISRVAVERGEVRKAVRPLVPTRRREKIQREKKVALPETIMVKDLAAKMGVSSSDVIKNLLELGVIVNINQEIDFDTASIIADEYGFDVEPESKAEAREFGIEDTEDDPASLVIRPPVVTIMGHVDHGKTSLLDVIRETNVTAQEAGGITQHIGAYQVELNGRKITFIDTPGHEAFTAMRARGAQVTDIAILVVAADDGVMPQTVEAINHARAAGVPIIVAINKIDKPNAQPDRVKQELSEHGLVPEEWGGDTVCVEVSALKRIGIEGLLEMILLVADMRDLKANPDRPAKGTVIEAELDKGRGPVATVLIEKGTLNIGDSIVVGDVAGRVRAMIDDKGESVRKAVPSMPVEVLGLSDVPKAGDILQVVPEDRLAKQLANRRQERKRAEDISPARRISLDDLFDRIKEGEVKELKLIIKADVQGSVEALRQALERLSTDEVKVNIIHSGVGAITESDIMLASASSAIVIGFQVRPDANAKKMAERDGVDVRLYRIIYDATEDIKAAMEGMLEPEYHEVVMGKAQVRATFKIPKVGMIAGSYVEEGKITRDADVRVLRDNIVVHEGKIESLKRFKDDVREVLQGFECGIGLQNFNDIKEGDIIEAFKLEESHRQL
ncbi:MAG: translation initiation factor IF-2 [Firmicutes bacterium]|nr:translation initiation factor IF-2 [Bacillota bacterium]